MSKHLTLVSKCQEIQKEMISRNADIVNELKQRYRNVFKGIGKHKFRKITLNVDESVPPVVQPVRRIPFAKREKPTTHVRCRIFVKNPGHLQGCARR